MKLPATMKMSATAKLSSNYTLSPGWHTPHISYPQTSFFFLLHSLLWSMTRHHNSIWPDQVCRKGSHCQNTGSCRRHDGSVGWGKKSAVCNRMSGLSCLITGATWDWMQRLHPCANSVCVCYFCRKMQRSLRKRLIQYSPLFFPPSLCASSLLVRRRGVPGDVGSGVHPVCGGELLPRQRRPLRPMGFHARWIQ